MQNLKNRCVMLKSSARFLCFSSLVILFGLVGCSSMNSKPDVIDTQEKTLGPISPKLKEKFGDALILLRNEQYIEAEIAFLDITAKHPDYPGPWSNLAVAQNKQDKYEDALLSLDKALQLDEGFCQAHSLKGVSLREMGKFQEAKKQYERAIKCNPEDNLSIYNLGVLSDLYLHDEPTALAYYQEYIKRLGEEADQTVRSWVIDLKRRVPEESITDINAIVNADADGSSLLEVPEVSKDVESIETQVIVEEETLKSTDGNNDANELEIEGEEK